MPGGDQPPPNCGRKCWRSEEPLRIASSSNITFTPFARFGVPITLSAGPGSSNNTGWVARIASIPVRKPGAHPDHIGERGAGPVHHVGGRLVHLPSFGNGAAALRGDQTGGEDSLSDDGERRRSQNGLQVAAGRDRRTHLLDPLITRTLRTDSNTPAGIRA